jgi:LemA protein
MWIAVLVAVVLAGLVVWLYNRLVQDRNQVAAGWSDVDVQLQRRHDLVPALVEVVKGYAGHEAEVLRRVVEERNASRAASRVGEKAVAEEALARDLRQLIALAEAYPELKASANFAQLASQLVEIEEHLQYARRFYNGAVRQFNDRQQQFPHLLLARPLGFRPAEFFEAEQAARAAPAVRL